MNNKFLKLLLSLPKPVLPLLLLAAVSACHSPGRDDSETATSENRKQAIAVDSARLAARRPAPEFYILTPETYKNRVYICDDIYSDVFHTKYECEVLNQCTATKKNVTMLNAIRENGRYNCEVCSPGLSQIFDKNLVR